MEPKVEQVKDTAVVFSPVGAPQLGAAEEKEGASLGAAEEKEGAPLGAEGASLGADAQSTRKYSFAH